MEIREQKEKLWRKLNDLQEKYYKEKRLLEQELNDLQAKCKHKKTCQTTEGIKCMDCGRLLK